MVVKLTTSDLDDKSETTPERKIMRKLVKCEGEAVWIPSFVNWLFENYNITEKLNALRERSDKV